MGVGILTEHNNISWASINSENKNSEMKFQKTSSVKMAALIAAPPVVPPATMDLQEGTTVMMTTTRTTTVVSVQRNPTMPLTKRDSLLMSSSRTSLISNGSVHSHSKVCEKDTQNSHPEMVAGKKRTPKKLKRTNSYKRALNRQSANDELDTVHIDVSMEQGEIIVESDAKALKKQDRKKYNTLPIKMTPTAAPSTTLSEKRRERKRDSDFQRNASQKSGTYPSPDTDEDQFSIQPERKKKSAFKRVKERLILTFRRDREEKHKKDKGQKYKKRPHGVSRKVHGRMKTGASKGFHTPEGRSIEDTSSDKLNNNSSSAITESDGAKRDNEDKTPKVKGSFNLFHSIRNSFRRKEAPQKYRTQKTQDPLHPIPEFLPNGHPPQSSQSLTSDHHRQPQPVSSSDTPSRVVEEEPTEEDDPITEVFGSIINQSGGSIRRPDRSKLNLVGLTKNRPRSFESKSPTGSNRYGQSRVLARGSDLSPTVEIDGLDYADAVPRQPGTEFREDSDDETDFALVSEAEQQHRLDDVARRLAAIGDRIAAEKESESEMSASEVEGHLPGLRRQSSFERSAIKELRKFADDRDFFRRGNLSITCVIPVLTSILAAQDYSTFKQIVQQELSNTIGWEQVAWYTYLMKTAVHIAGTGKKLVVNTMAKKYFTSKLKPFIESRPNGWESIHEETDVDTELD